MRKTSIERCAASETSGFDAGARLRSHLAALEKLALGVPAEGRQAAVANAGAALKSLQRGLTGDRNLAGARYFSEADYLKAYLLYYWPVSFVQVTMALEELRSRGELPRIGRILDIGAGPGPASFAAIEAAAADAADEAGGAAARQSMYVTLVDWNAEALEAARRLAAIEARGSITLEPLRRDLEADPRLEGGPYDLIIACHSVNELWKGRDDALERRTALFSQACGLLAEGGILLVVEPSATVTSRPALALRDRLLADAAAASGGEGASGGESGGLRCAGPCPGSYPCPIAAAGGERSCHSTWPWTPAPMVADLARAAGLDRDSAKATWFALKKEPAAAAAAAIGTAQGDGPASSSLAGRVVSEPMLNKAGRVRYIICAAEGLATLSAKRDAPAARESGFLDLRRGDCISVSGLERREGENNFGIAPGTTLAYTFRAPDASRELPQPQSARGGRRAP